VERPHSYARYKVDGCRCYTCCYAVSQYNAARKAAIAADGWRVDADLVRRHVQELGRRGMGYKLVADRAGVSRSTLGRIIYGRTEKGTAPPATTRRDIAERILAVEFGLHDYSPTGVTGSARRIQALVAHGHTITSVAAQAGWTLQNVSKIAHRWSPTLEVRNARLFAGIYDRLWSVRPDGLRADRARQHAARQGWFGPLAWDDDTIDDPAALPCLAPPVDGSDPDVDELVVQHVIAGHPVDAADLTGAVRDEVVLRLGHGGWPRARMAELLNTSPKYVDQIHIRATRRAARRLTTEDVAA